MEYYQRWYNLSWFNNTMRNLKGINFVGLWWSPLAAIPVGCVVLWCLFTEGKYRKQLNALMHSATEQSKSFHVHHYACTVRFSLSALGSECLAALKFKCPAQRGVHRDLFNWNELIIGLLSKYNKWGQPQLLYLILQNRCKLL